MGNICCGHKFVSGTKNVSDFFQKHFVSATNVSQFTQPKKHHEQQCVRNNVSSFAMALRYKRECFISCKLIYTDDLPRSCEEQKNVKSKYPKCPNSRHCPVVLDSTVLWNHCKLDIGLRYWARQFSLKREFNAGGNPAMD